MKDWASVQTYKSGTFPNVLAIDSTGAATPDGTEYIAAQINNGIFGWMQDFMDYAGLTPDGVIEAAAACQLREAIQKGNGIGPGKLVGWFLDDDPSVTGDRVLLLEGQGILHASYPELTVAVYVGDANNAAVAAGGGKFYKSSDAGGLTPSTSGTYLQLPEARGYTLRGLDPSATVDPDGASRYLGDVQGFGTKMHIHRWYLKSTAASARGIACASTPANQGDVIYKVNGAGQTIAAGWSTLTEASDSLGTAGNFYVEDSAVGDAKDESRMTNLSIKLGITY